jgi:hypothetical protein
MTANKIPAMSAFDADLGTATIHLNGVERHLYALRRGPRGDGIVEISVYGFAARFHSGSKLWRAIAKYRDLSDGRYQYLEVTVRDFNTAGQGYPPQIVGYEEDFASERFGTPQGEGTNRWRLGYR